MKILAPERPKKKSYTVRLPDDQRDFLEKVAKENKVSPAVVLRDLVGKAKAKES